MKKDSIKTVLHTIRRFDMLEERQKVLAAVSGGPDSIFLFHALSNLQHALKICIAIAHLDHGLRGEDSRRDAQFVKHLARSFGIPFFCKRIDVGSRTKKSKMSQEEVARKLRYEFLVTTAQKKGCRVIATGHTLDDHAETVLMRIVKGAALKGVIGIPPVRQSDGIRIIRPLIDVTKEEITDYLKMHAIPFRTDATNLEDRYLRNRVRKHLIPYLKRYNPQIKHALANLAENLREDFEFIEEEKRRRWSDLTAGGRHRLRLKDIIVQPRALRKEIIRDALADAGANIKKVTYRHWKEVDGFIRLKERGKSIDLPGGVRIKKEQDSLCFVKLQQRKDSLPT